MEPRLDGERPRDDQPGHDERRDQPQAERHETDRPETRDGRDGRQDERLDGDAGQGQRRVALVGEHLERPEQHRDEQQDRDQPQRRRLHEPRQPDDGHRRQREVAAAESVVHRPDGTRDVHHGRALTSGPASRRPRRSSSVEGPRVQHVGGLDPGASRLADAPADVVELAGLVGVRVDRQQAPVGDGPAGALDGEVQPMGRPVDLEGRAGPRGLGVDLVPLEVEVVARAEHPAGGVRDDVDVRAPDRVERPLRQFRPRLPSRDVERGHDEVERGQQVVLEVELAVRPDLELAAVQEPEPAGRRLRRRGPGRSPRPRTCLLSAAMISCCSATWSGRRPRAMASDCVWSVRTW